MPRKTRIRGAGEGGLRELDASMRPRPDAAENGVHVVHADGDRHASMRPRPDAAENTDQLDRAGVVAPVASMRPRPDAAENPGAGVGLMDKQRRFNEAAARCRGKPRRPARPARGGLPVASMRPRPDAAENECDAGGFHDLPPCASMRPRPDAAENGA